jgi:hypothetical protein
MFKASPACLQTFIDTPNCVFISFSVVLIYIIILCGPDVLYRVVIKSLYIQGNHKTSVHQLITIQKATSHVQSVPRLSPDIY